MTLLIKQNISLAGYSSYHIGGIAKFFTEIKDGNDAIEVLKFVQNNNLPIFFLGSGTNVLISDRGFSGLAARVCNNEIRFSGLEIEVGAGMILDDLVSLSAKAGLKGLEWAAGIPGTIGGAIRGNAGAFGGEIKDNLKLVKIFKPWGNHFILQPLLRDECDFSYRSSVFKKKNDLIFSAVFEFQQGDKFSLEREIKARRYYRNSRYPIQYPNIGSIFKNIVNAEEINSFKINFPEFSESITQKWRGKIAVAGLFDYLGLKGKKIGGVEVSNKHANFIINSGAGLAEDVVMLMSLMQSKASERFGVRLEPEVQLVFK